MDFVIFVVFCWYLLRKLEIGVKFVFFGDWFLSYFRLSQWSQKRHLEHTMTLYIHTKKYMHNMKDIIYAHVFHSEAPHDILFATSWNCEFSYSFGKLSDQPQLRWITPSCPWLFWSRNSHCGELNISQNIFEKKWAESVSVSGFCLHGEKHLKNNNCC